MIVDYILDLPDAVARQFAVGIGMETADPVTGEDINETTQEVDDYLTVWLQIEIDKLVKETIKKGFLEEAKAKAQLVLDSEVAGVENFVDSIMRGGYTWLTSNTNRYTASISQRWERTPTLIIWIE